MRWMDATEEAYKNGYAAGLKAAEEKIVHCKDCKHFNAFVEPFNKVGNCRKSVGLNTENHFCSYGERREDG